jgi:hypothetical protein
MLDFNRWMKINDINMTSWVHLLWNCIVVENELQCIYCELQLYNSCNLFVSIHDV